MAPCGAPRASIPGGFAYAWHSQVAERAECSTNTVSKWHSRFVQHRLDGLVDDPRPGRPATITADQVEDVVVTTLESTSKNATHWSRAKMARRTGLSSTTIGRIWKAFGLKPHLEDGFKSSSRCDASFGCSILG